MEIEQIIEKAATECGLIRDGFFSTAYEPVARRAIELAQTEWKKRPQNSYADGYNKGYDDGFLKAEEAIRGGETFKAGYNRGYKKAAEFFRSHPEMLLNECCVDMSRADVKCIPFDIERAKNGHSVCTRDGEPVRIICYDKEGEQPIVGLVNNSQVCCYYLDGTHNRNFKHSGMDLMLKVETKEAWINIYDDNCGFYKHNSEHEAKENIARDRKYITTTKITWYE